MPCHHAYVLTRRKKKVEIAWACHWVYHLFVLLGYLQYWRDRLYLVERRKKHLKNGALLVGARLYNMKKNERWMKGKDWTGAGMLPLC